MMLKFFLTLILTAMTYAPPLQAEDVKKVYISQTTRHPALDLTTEGILEALKSEGFVPGKNLEVKTECAQGNSGLAAQIATQFSSQTPDVAVGVGTLAAQSLAPYANQSKFTMVFSTVTDPLGAKLIPSLETPGGMITGVSNFVGLKPQLQLFKKLAPSLTRLGVLYNPGEPNSVAIVEKLEKLCPELGLELVKQTLLKTSDASASARQLASNSHAIFISNDNTALSCINAIRKATDEVKIPLFVSDTDAVAQGALAALGPNQKDIGKQTGRMIARILKGENAREIPVEFPIKTDLLVNREAAHSLGIEISAPILKKSRQVIGKNTID